MIVNEPKLLQALLREKLIAAKDSDAFHAAAHGKGRGDSESIAQLLDDQANVLTTAKVAKARAKKAEKQEQDLEQAFDRAAARANKKDLSGLVFAETGRLKTFETRNELKVYLDKFGATLASSVTVKTDYLVTNSQDERNLPRIRDCCRKPIAL